MPFSLHPAQKSDIPTLGQITSSASFTDTHTQLKSDYAGYNHEQTMTEALSTWLDRPPTRCQVTKAVDDTSDEILGWIVWGFHGYDNDNDTNPNNHTPLTPPPPPPSPPPRSKGISGLSDYTDTSMQDWKSHLMPPGSKCTYIISLVVSPSHHHKGIGTALINQGTSIADADGVYSWVHSSEDGAGFFRKCGFEEVGRLVVDLDEVEREELELQEQRRWASEGKAGGGELGGGFDSVEQMKVEKGDKYGVYTFRYMKRLPVAQ